MQRLCEPLPRLTPHVLRHTFYPNMANAGMDVKSLQYLMGHSDVEKSEMRRKLEDTFGYV